MSTSNTFDGQQLPRLVFYSKSGSLPYLSWNYVRKHGDIIYRDDGEPQKYLTTVYLGHLCDLYEKTKVNSENSPTKFAKLPLVEGVTLLATIFDPLEPYGNFKSTPEAIPFHSYQGKKMITVPQAIDMTDRCVAADYLQALADVNAPSEAKTKWTTKVVKRTEEMLTKTLEQLEASDGDQQQQPKVFGTITGGYSERSRLESCRALRQHSSKLAGVIIESFYGYHKVRDGGEYFEDRYTPEVDRMLRTVIIPELPPTLPRALFGAFMPDDMLRLVGAGVDLLDTSVCTLLTQHGMALPSPLIDRTGAVARLRFVRLSFDEIREHSGRADDVWPESIIHLGHVGYVDDHKPLSSRCTCHICHGGGYSRAYLNHMLKRGEINGKMLLQMHNHWAITQFMAEVRNIVREGLLPTLIDNSNV